MENRQTLANAIRILSMDAVQRANSGHPGMPMGMADIAEVLWNDFLKHNPNNSQWLNRDRFVLSNGHGCMLLYSLLHLSGYDLSLEEIKNFRQLHSKTPGHPEYKETPGVETTTGPLGQGLANAVGMAMAEKHLSAEFNREGFPIIDHYTYVFVGDGCLMEGISHEVCSLAATFGLNKLIVIYDDNGISIDGNVNQWFTDDTAMRFRAYGWHVIENIDGHDSEQVKEALAKAKTHTDKPTLLCCKTIIGWGSPTLAGTADTHGAPLGSTEIAAIRQKFGWSTEPFHVPAEIYAQFNAVEKGKKWEDTWQTLFNQYAKVYPDLASELLRRMNQAMPENFFTDTKAFIETFKDKKENIATRKASQLCLNHFSKLLPELMGGSADLTGSNLTNWKNVTVFSKENPKGQYIHYGVREFGMSAIMNGMAIHGGLIPFGGTFLTFSDYARNAVRLSALMQCKSIFVYTHDSIGLGEDGPTHQPIEHLPSLRLIPNLKIWRPCDTTETAIAWQTALAHNGPSCLVLTRQGLEQQPRSDEQINLIKRGGYILKDSTDNPKLILIATGSEVQLAINAAKLLAEQNIAVRVISMPSTETFLAEDLNYQHQVLPPAIINRIAIEAASKDYWLQFVGEKGKVIGIDRFGASAPADVLFKEYGFTVEKIVAAAYELLAQRG